MANANTNANANAPNVPAPTALAPRVLLAFDDFSLAGRHLLHHIAVKDASASTVPPTVLPEALQSHVHVVHHAVQAQLYLSVVTVATTDLDSALLWTVADALVQWLSSANIQSLRVVASLHVPQAKPHARALDNVYVATIGSDAASTTSLPVFDARWEITDAFLVRLLHCVRVEQAFTTELLVVKGYRPGRDGAGMRDAITALAAALPLVEKDVSVDVLRADADATKAVLTSSKQQGHSSLYQ